MEGRRPRLTVVIPTMGKRPERLATALEAIAGQDLQQDELEVVLGCDPGVPLPRVPDGLALRVVEAHSPSSAAAKRNLALRHAAAPFIAFTDDDCRPADGWGAALLAAHDTEPRAFVQGRTEPDPREKDDLWGLAHTQLILRDSPWHETCNIAYPRDLLERLNGFDEGYGQLGGEDTDLGARALASGAPKIYEEDAVVWHAVEPRSFRQALRESFRPRDQPQVLARFPELRDELMLGIFYRRGHGLLLIALAGALTRRRLVGRWPRFPTSSGTCDTTV